MSEAKTAPIWKGAFGKEYAARNLGKVPSNTAMFAKILQRTHNITSVLEFGCGTGQNLIAIQNLLTPVDIYGIEINEQAANVARLQTINGVACQDYLKDGLPMGWPTAMDLTMTKGVLIHTAPADLRLAYHQLINRSNRYILIAEYYNPTPVEVMYRGMPAALWKRDFCKEIIKLAQSHGTHLRLIDYGFQYHGDHSFPQDDITWFLMEKVK